MKRIEKIIVKISIVSILLNFFLFPGGITLTFFSFLFLAIIYFAFSLSLFIDIKSTNMFLKSNYKDISWNMIIGVICFGISLSFLNIGILFKLVADIDATFFLIVGLFGLAITTVIGVIKYLNSNSKVFIPIFERIAVFGIIGLLLLLTPKSTYIDAKYRNHKDYANAVKNLILDPTNEDLQKIVDNEKTKMEQSE